MELKEIMSYKNFVVVGNTIVEGKYAKTIKDNLIHYGYNVSCVYKELTSINDIKEDIDVIDLCINPMLGINLLKECKKDYKVVLIQPGAESEEIISYLNSINKPYLKGCALVGLRMYKGSLLS